MANDRPEDALPPKEHTDDAEPVSSGNGSSAKESRGSSPARRSSSAGPSSLEQRVREETGSFKFNALTEGIDTRRHPPTAVVKSTPPLDSPRGELESADRRPTGRTYALIVGTLLVIIAAAALAARAWRARSDSASATEVGGIGAPIHTAGSAALARFRLPVDPDVLGAGSQIQAPIFILSDFEVKQGGWKPDTRLPACRHAFVQRVRDGAQQGTYWLKMDGLTLVPGRAQQAALIVHPDSTDLSRRGSTVSAALFVPKKAPRGLRAQLAIKDSRGTTHWQDKGEILPPGRWVIVRWDAGPLLKDVQQLAVVVNSPDTTYKGYVGLDNVQLRHDVGAPDIGDLEATATAQGFVRVGDQNRFLTQVDIVVCGTDWQITTPKEGTVRTQTASDHVTAEGRLVTPGEAEAAIPFRTTVRIADDRTLEVNVEATPRKQMQVRAVAGEVLLPKSLYGNASIDMTSASEGSVPAAPLCVGVTAAEAHVAGDFPHGFTLKPGTPSAILVSEETVPTVFRYTANRDLQAVHLVGAFNDWNAKATPMAPSEDGRSWTVTVPMTPGEQSYKFVLNDGEKITDPKSVKNVRDAQGNLNSVCFVPAPHDSGSRAFHLWVPLAGRTDGAPVMLTAGKTLHTSFRLTYNQPFRSALAHTRSVDAVAANAPLHVEGFERGVQGWACTSSLFGDLSTSTAQAFAGTHSLAVPIHSSGADKGFVYMSSPSTSAGETVTYHVWVPKGSKLASVQPFVQQGGDANYLWTGNYQPITELRQGGWNTLTVTVPSNAVTPLFRLGVEFVTSGAWSGTCYVDSISW